ncbi:hypothetical protein LC55x_0995 [Lysobacter capsici]|nr:hypothetical protein LC55x_0995 [Lysobacter capsici]
MCGVGVVRRDSAAARAASADFTGIRAWASPRSAQRAGLSRGHKETGASSPGVISRPFREK